MTHPRNAKPGYLYYSVITPAVSVERLLPEDPEKDTKKEARVRNWLEDTADLHRTTVQTRTYQLL